MKRLIFILAFLPCFCINAQITITSADMPVVGDTFTLVRDSFPSGFSIGQAGANRTWDFSNLQADEQVTTYAVAPSSTPYASDFPNANLTLTNDFVFFLYYQNTAPSLKVEGFANTDPTLGVVSVNFNIPLPEQHQFPATYLTNFAGTSSFTESTPFNQLPPNIQQDINNNLLPGTSVSQVRLIFNSNYTDTIDAWGTVITPVGTYEALRRKRIENSNTKIEAQIQVIFPPTSFWQEISNTNSVTTDHSWLAKDTKLPLVTLGYDSLRNIIAATYSTIPPPPVAGFTWANPSGGLVNFTNTSQNAATYQWDFDDGSNSTQLNPQHIYAANGDYYVCLTASNAGGSDTFCDTVRVTGVSAVNNPPIANRDSVQVVAPNSVQISPLDNDIDPNGDSIFYVPPFFPALNGTVTHLGNALFEYTPNANFRGIDSFQYVIRDNGSPVLRDTGTVVIRVDGAPFANFSYSKNERTVTFVNLSSGETSVSWDLGEGTIETTDTVVHTYAADGDYNVCLTAINSFGNDDTCKLISVVTVGINELANENIRIIPNPSSGVVRIETGNRVLAKVEVIDLNGRILISQIPQTANQYLTLDITSLPQGFYVCKLTSADGSIVAGKLIKE